MHLINNKNPRITFKLVLYKSENIENIVCKEAAGMTVIRYSLMGPSHILTTFTFRLTKASYTHYL